MYIPGFQLEFVEYGKQLLGSYPAVRFEPVFEEVTVSKLACQGVSLADYVDKATVHYPTF
ncbi:hypothetical protein WJ59_04445 [Burkholderia gladioli]|nr:hypothetical protein WJ59_04445 [Burkholderia gladioli]